MKQPGANNKISLSAEKMNPVGIVTMIFINVKTGKTRKKVYRNLITNAGKIAILRRLNNVGAVANEGIITYGAVGTSTTAPLVTDTTLGTEIERIVKSATSSITDQTLELRCFFNEAEANGALKEFGWFGEDASAAADSGTMFNHVAIDETKTAAETLTIVQTIDL